MPTLNQRTLFINSFILDKAYPFNKQNKDFGYWWKVTDNMTDGQFYQIKRLLLNSKTLAVNKILLNLENYGKPELRKI